MSKNEFVLDKLQRLRRQRCSVCTPETVLCMLHVLRDHLTLTLAALDQFADVLVEDSDCHVADIIAEILLKGYMTRHKKKR